MRRAGGDGAAVEGRFPVSGHPPAEAAAAVQPPLNTNARGGRKALLLWEKPFLSGWPGGAGKQKGICYE